MRLLPEKKKIQFKITDEGRYSGWIDSRTGRSRFRWFLNAVKNRLEDSTSPQYTPYAEWRIVPESTPGKTMDSLGL